MIAVAGGVPGAFTSYAGIAQELTRDFYTLFDALVLKIPALLAAAIVYVATRVAANVASRSAAAVGRRAIRSESLRILLHKTATVGVWIVGVLVISLLIFPGLRLGDLVATLGLGSVAIGFAFQDIFKNFLAGILLLLNEPFRIGDQIVVGTFEGTVERIDIRFTSLRSYTDERFLLPNSLVFTSPVQVRTAFDARRTDLEVGVAYGSDLTCARAAIGRALNVTKGVLAHPEPVVDLTKFDDSSIDVVARYWTRPLQSEVLRTQTRAVLAIDAALREDGVDIAFPTRTLIIAASPPPVREASAGNGRFASE